MTSYHTRRTHTNTLVCFIHTYMQGGHYVVSSSSWSFVAEAVGRHCYCINLRQAANFSQAGADLCNNNAKLVIWFSLRTSFCRLVIRTYKGMYRRANGYTIHSRESDMTSSVTKCENYKNSSICSSSSSTRLCQSCVGCHIRYRQRPLIFYIWNAVKKKPRKMQRKKI